MNRRNLISRFGALAFGIAAFRFTDVVSANERTASPHSEAIALVVEKQQNEIAQAELEYFKENGVDWWRGEIELYRWHDTITRSWSATRPFAPGVFDSTHVFEVVYSINGKAVSSWSVETRKKKAELNKPNAIKIETRDK